MQYLPAQPDSIPTVYKTEPELGLAIKESGVDRSKLFVTTKVMGSIGDPESALKTSLKKLQLDYADLCVSPNPTACFEG